MTRLALPALCVFLLAALAERGQAQARKVSPESRFGPSGTVRTSVISPDGRTVAYVLVASTGVSLHAATATGVRTLAELASEPVIYASADSRFLVYREASYDEPLMGVALDGSSAPFALTPPSLAVELGRGLQFSAQGWVVFLANESGSDSMGLYAAPLRERRPPVRLDGPAPGGGRPWYFEVSPDGAWVAYVGDPDGVARYELFLAPITGAAEARTVNGPLVDGGWVQAFHFSPSSERLVYLANAARLNSNELFSVAVLGAQPAVRISAAGVDASNVLSDFALSDDGEFALYRHNPFDTGVQELFRAPIKGHAEPTRVSAPLVSGGDVQTFAFASDGAVLYRADQEVDNRRELFLAADGRPPRKLNAPLAAGQDVSYFQVAPDGKRVLFVVQEPETVYLTSVSGAAPIPLPGVPGASPSQPFALSASGAELVVLADDTLFAWRLDGTSTPVELELAGERALVHVRNEYSNELFSVPLAGGTAPARFSAPLPMDRPLDHVWTSALALDGRWTAFAFGEYDEAYLFAADLELGTPALRLGDQALTSQSTRAWFRISPGARRVVFRTAGDELASVPIDGSAPPLVLDPAPTTEEIQLSPDGNHVLHLDAGNHLRSAALDGSSPAHELGGFEGAGSVNFERFRIGAGGARVAYHFRGSLAGSELLAAPIDGSGAPVRLAPARTVDRLLGIAAHERVVFQTLVTGGVLLWSVPIDGSAAPTALAAASLYQTPDDDQVCIAGELVFYVATSGGLFAVPADGRAPPRRVTPEHHVSGLWLRTRHLYFTGAPLSGGPADLYGLPLDLATGPVRLGRRASDSFVWNVVESSDGSLAVYLQGDGDQALYSVTSDGSREPLRLTDPLVYREYELERIRTDFALGAGAGSVAYVLQFDHYHLESSTSEVFAAPSRVRGPAELVSDAPRDQRQAFDFHLDPAGRFALYSGNQERADAIELFVAPVPPPTRDTGHAQRR